MTDDKSIKESAEKPKDSGAADRTSYGSEGGTSKNSNLSDIIARKRKEKNLPAGDEAFEAIRRNSHNQFGDMIYSGNVPGKERENAGSSRKKDYSGTGAGDKRRKSNSGTDAGDNRRKSNSGTGAGGNRRKNNSGTGTGDNRRKNNSGTGTGNKRKRTYSGADTGNARRRDSSAETAGGSRKTNRQGTAGGQTTPDINRDTNTMRLIFGTDHSAADPLNIQMGSASRERQKSGNEPAAKNSGKKKKNSKTQERSGSRRNLSAGSSENRTSRPEKSSGIHVVTDQGRRRTAQKTSPEKQTNLSWEPKAKEKLKKAPVKAVPEKIQLSEVELFRRRKRERKLKVFAATFAVLFILIAGVVSLRVTEVNVEGCTRYSDEEIVNYIVGTDFSANPIVFFLREKFGKKAEIPFVDKYTVQLTGATSADIIIYEKNIVGYLNVMENYVYIDQDGYVLEISEEAKNDVPCITGLKTDSVVMGEKLNGVDDIVFDEIKSISRFVADTSISWSGKDTVLSSILTSIAFDASDNVTCDFGQIKVYLGSEDDLEDKLLEMSNILPQLQGKSGTLYLNTYNEAVDDPSYVFK